MIRILQCVNNMHRAGLETMLMNYYRNIDRTQIQFDFLTHRPERSDYDDEIEALGGRIYRAPRLYPQNYPAYFAYMRRFFREHPEYRIIHSHIDAMSYLPLLAAKKAGLPVRIAHSHSTSIDKDFKYPLKLYFRSKLSQAANVRLACGEEAGHFLFGEEPFTVISNAIDPEPFYFDPEVRQRKRDALGINAELVIGHVGRFSYPKNHRFLVEVFQEVNRRQQNAVLLLTGTGEKEQEIRDQVQMLNLEEKVLFLGSRDDVSELYQAMDVFVMPSLFEGVPLVGIEAQAAGLPCIFSDRVPKEVQIAGNCEFLPLEKAAPVWAERILAVNSEGRADAEEMLRNSRYNIKHTSNILENFYLSM